MSTARSGVLGWRRKLAPVAPDDSFRRIAINDLAETDRNLKSEKDTLQSEVNDLSGDFEDANDLIFELEESVDEYVETVRGKELQIQGLSFDCMRMLYAIGIGRREFLFFVRLSSLESGCVPLMMRLGFRVLWMDNFNLRTKLSRVAKDALEKR